MMNAISENPRVVIGGNGPPEPTPFERAEETVTDLYDEAKLWLDGAKVDNQDLADGIANLLNFLRSAEKQADTARTEEKAPHLEAGRAVDAKYKPLLDMTKRATDACKKALAPWLVELENKRAAAAQKAREEAEEKARIAQEALRSTDAANLEARAQAEALVDEAKKANRTASRIENNTSKVGGAVGRAVSLRTHYAAEVTDANAFTRFIWLNYRADMAEFLGGFAKQLVDAGKRDLPGVTVHEEKGAV
jgi:hypothetical protein